VVTAKSLTIWIPTYRRPEQLLGLLASIRDLQLLGLAEVVVSDNDQTPACAALAEHRAAGIAYRQNVANLSAGVNFLRGFEECRTPWLMIVGDDDRFVSGAATILREQLLALPEEVVAVKFDSSLFGAQPACRTAGLMPYLQKLRPGQYPEAFNNLLLISTWLFRVEPCRRHLASAYLGYSSKCSHLFPALQACAQGGGQLAFSPLQPIRFGVSDEGWPRAATWYEMAMTLSTFCGFIDSANRRALLQLLFHDDWPRIAVKCLRVGPFYDQPGVGVPAWMIHRQLGLLHWRYGLLVLLLLPVLLWPWRRWPRALRRRIGAPGRVDRW
jgi:glycosyltransferase involved in cell wall biosynthesis